MARKRKRTAYTALSSARVLRYQPHHTSRTQTPAALHITPAPPESITDFPPTQPDQTPTPPPPIPTRRSASRPSPHTPTITPTPPPHTFPTSVSQDIDLIDTSTPLILRACDVTSVQAALGFTPDTPAHSTVFLGVHEQRHAMALINSPHQHYPPPETPHPSRRLSLGSTVTPIPLHLESPEKVNIPQPTPMLSSHHPLPSPLTPHQHRHTPTHQVQIPSPPPSPVPQIPMEHQSDGLLDLAPLSTEKNPDNYTKTANNTLLITTAADKPVPLPHKSLTTPLQSEPSPLPLFTTARGKPLAPLGSRSLAQAAKLFNHSPSVAPLLPKNLVRSLFSTGKGKPVHIPNPANQRSRVLGTPMADKTNVSSLFTTGSGKRVSVPSSLKPVTSILHRPPPSPHTPSIERNTLRKALFSDGTPPSNLARPLERASPACMTVKNSADKPIRARQSGPALKTTPFRRPRRVASSKEAIDTPKTVIGRPAIPKWEVPQLSKRGSIFCRSPLHDRHRQASPSSTGTHRIPDFLLAPTCLQSCLHFVFDKKAFGRYDCLPEDVLHHFQLNDIASFSVGNVISWTRVLFPAAVAKPATCVGSAAWTRMSYSLALWKLAKLEKDRQGGNSTAVDSFLSAANLLREIIRRIHFEWHLNRQPHLLRMMRKDSSPASHVVLNLSGLELNAESKIVLVLSDGWYLARAVTDATVQRRIWNGTLRVGDKVSITGASLQDNEGTRLFFFGDGDELGSYVLRLFTNGIRKAPHGTQRLGNHPSPSSGSLRWIQDDGGKCPTLEVLILRSYPVFYMESLSSENIEDNGRPYFTSRREEGEDQARAVHEEKIRHKLQTGAEQRRENKDDNHESQDVDYRDVRAVKEFLICGVKDDPSHSSARKFIRVYNVSEALQALTSREGQSLLLSHVLPKKNGWTCKPDGIRLAPRLNEKVEILDFSKLLRFPRNLCSVPELRNGAVTHGDDFDGVFLVLYVTPDGSNRFAYLTSAPTEIINVLALQLSEADSECLPRALRFKHGLRPRFPLIGIRDAKYCYRDSKLDILHANATMRTSFIMPRSLSRMRRSNPMRSAFDDLESQVRGREPHLEVLRDAVISFASGNRSSVSAYFTSTQDM